MEPSIVVLGLGEDVNSRDSVPFAASPTIINKNVRADTWIPEQQLQQQQQQQTLGKEEHRASFYTGGMRDSEVNSSDPVGKQGSDCWKPIVGRDRHVLVFPAYQWEHCFPSQKSDCKVLPLYLT